MKKRLRKKMKKQEELIQGLDVFISDDYLQVKCHISRKVTPSDYEFAFYTYQTGIPEAVDKSKYTKFDTHQVLLKSGGEYRVKVFVRHLKSNEVVTKISQPIRKTRIVKL
ncbi:hypothetical protein ACRW9N_10640 [Listeria aquatica]|uniref:Uncharacterized protein n=1 Tax=Listeria aquatica FSL S10-1188 TaxID=1265818 RepID=W7B4Z7_9LIST|nr:hypothetical protein [Listeria aquatica]EUJ20972.1 hypothetical protein MAQA_03251 [Listeria aquatica FSL S10-1188]